uniref:39S ribosomal protein L52, mitochondrial n=1 Tax=Steinernema glaseri TaxID=37863 RepID=A0A1I7YMG7_9BILA
MERAFEKLAKLRHLPRARQVPGGRFQQWKNPIYVSPHISPLQRGVDFTFQDGRPIYVTSKVEADRKLEQIELGKTIVKYLADMREVEKMYIDAEAHKLAAEAEKQRWTPRSKGTEDIF